jgi:ribonuclease HII
MNKKGVVGVDEAGRGPLAGPVAVGAVYVPPGYSLRSIPGIKDSKQMTARERERVYARLRAADGIRCAVALTSSAVIDAHGIQYAIRDALRRALRKLQVSPDEVVVLLDGGLRAPEEYTRQRTIIRGDATERVIGAASTVAKVTRDRYMVREHTRYPVYGFDEHKGYGTANHRMAIRKQGLSPIHRRTFCRNIPR